MGTRWFRSSRSIKSPFKGSPTIGGGKARHDHYTWGGTDRYLICCVADVGDGVSAALHLCLDREVESGLGEPISIGPDVASDLLFLGEIRDLSLSGPGGEPLGQVSWASGEVSLRDPPGPDPVGVVPHGDPTNRDDEVLPATLWAGKVRSRLANLRRCTRRLVKMQAGPPERH